MTNAFTPATQSELARFVAENAQGVQRPLTPVGGRTALHFGHAGKEGAQVVELNGLSKVVDYPARDMTVTVEAGLRVDELQTLLRTERQRLPIDIAQSARATIGGAIATNTSGPRRFGHGTFRDYVIGISAVDAHGKLFKGGGRVVKNVAGYDLCKLLTGSRGTLGIISQVTLKLRPVAETSAFLWCPFEIFAEIENALGRLLQSDARPVALEVLAGSAAHLIANEARAGLPSASPVLCVGVEGTPQEVEWQLYRLRKEITPYGVQDLIRVEGESADHLWTALTEFQTSADDPLTFQANLLPSRCMEFADAAVKLGVSVQVHAGNGIVIGQLPEEAATVEQALAALSSLRQFARQAKGNLQVLHCDPEWKSRMPMCGDPEPAWPLMRQLKQSLDPHGLLNPGRFIDA